MSRPLSAEGVVVARVRRGSPASDAGLLPGDRLLAINGTPLRDAIDFYFHSGEERLQLAYLRDGTARSATIRRTGGAKLGLELAPPRPGEISTCANKCVFCFIHQLPRGMRKSLYVKDDDYRLSFLHGNYITLTDLDEEALARIEAQRLSPLYVSVHATDPELRHRLLGQPRLKRPILPLMERLARAGITMHAQIVLCPEWNDGPHLERSVRDLAGLYPGVATAAVVPVGLTRHRERLPKLRSVTAEEARQLVRQIEAWQREFTERLGGRFVFAADELYLLGGIEIPPARHYEGFPLLEDGVGLVRRFLDGWERVVRRLPPALPSVRRVIVVTGEMFAPLLTELLRDFPVDVVPIVNNFFGRAISVAGLLTGQDILAQLAPHSLGDLILVPAVALKDGDGVFLDDLTPRDLASHLGVPVKSVASTPRALLSAILGGDPFRFHDGEADHRDRWAPQRRQVHAL
jgi:putative radical SAM enzyme (TIGR03279 family)